MYKIFVVEDELLIRQNIRDQIERMQGPYSFCGEASDGEMALSMIQELMPDILLTDIRMSFLDGLGLIRHAKAIMPWLKVAIISGYGDFEYAQKAISLGVDQYLLKPVRPGELTKAIEAMAAQIEKARAVPGEIGREEVHSALKREWLERLLYDKPELSGMLEQAQALGLAAVKSHYLVTIVSFDTSDADPYQLKSAAARAMESAGQTMYLFNSADQLTMLCCDNDAVALNESVYQVIGVLRHELGEICPVLTVVIGRRAQRLGGVGETYHEAHTLMRAVRNICAGKVINMNDGEDAGRARTADIGAFGEDFQRKLQYVTAEQVPMIVDEIMDSPEGSRFESMLIRYHALLSAIEMGARMKGVKPGSEAETQFVSEVNSRYDLMAASGSKKRFRETVTGILQMAKEARQEDEDCAGGYQYVIARAKKYAQENFSDPNISLLSVSQHVGMSSAYFSTVFSQTTGQSFISYLTGLRIERAKQLLRTTDMRLGDIAAEIGYSEPNYFSHVFRKAEGVSPKEYRQRGARQ